MPNERVDKLENSVKLIEGKVDSHVSQFNQFMALFKEHTRKEEENLEKRFSRLEHAIEGLIDKLDKNYVRQEQFDTKCQYLDERIRKNEGVVTKVAWTIIGAVILAILSLILTQ